MSSITRSTLCLLFFLCLLAGCGEPPSETGERAPAVVETVFDADIARKQYAGLALEVLDVSERNHEGRNALAVTLSVPLDPASDFQPYLSVSKREGGRVDGAWVLSEAANVVYFPFVEPETEYEVTVYQGLSAVTGKVLAQNQSAVIKTRKVVPAVSFSTNGSLLPMDLGSGLPVTTINIDAVDIDFHRIRPANWQRFLSDLNRRHYRRYNPQQLAQMGELAYSGRFDLNPEANTLTRLAIPVRDIEALREPGLYVAVMRQAGTYPYAHRYQITHFMVTDLGLHARLYADRLDVHLSSLTSAQPLSGVRVSLLDRHGERLVETRSTPAGLASFASPDSRAQLIVAETEGQLAIIPLKGAALDLTEFDLGSRPYRPVEAFVYTPRDLYRPGETVAFSVLMRDHDGHMLQLPPLRGQLRRPDGNLASSLLLEPQALGYHSADFTLPESAPTGQWELVLHYGDGEQVVYPFQVEDFLPERMQLSFNDGRQAPLVFAPEVPVVVPVQGDYLYGAPAAGNRLSVAVQTRLLRHPIDALPDYYFGDETEADTHQRFNLEDIQLDEQGGAQLRIESRWAKLHSPLSLRLTGSLYESGGRPVTRSYAVRILPPGPLLGIRPNFGDASEEPAQAQANSQVSFDIAHAAADGELLAASHLELRLIKEDRQYFWSHSDARGWHYEFTEKEFPVMADTLQIAAGEVARFSAPVDWGRYRLEVEDPARGIRSSYRFHAGRDWYRHWARSQEGSQGTRPDRINLALDKAAYRGGDNATLTVNAPHAGELLVLVEGDAPLWQKRLRVTEGPNQVTIPVAAGWARHDLYVSTVLLRPANERALITPNRAVGLIHLPLDRSQRRLEVNINLPEKLEPAQTVTAGIKVVNHQPGETLYVTLAAVDVGVLNISDFETPDPFEGFFGRRRYGVESRDIYGDVIELNRHRRAALRFGGDADLARGGKEPLSEVQIVSLFQRPVQLDAQGRASIELPLPYFNGRLRVMALAYGESRFGSADREATVAAPVVTQMALPRFIGWGDRSQVALDIHNLSGEARELHAELTAAGDLKSGQWQQPVTLADDEKTTLYFPVEAAAGFGNGSLELRLSGEGVKPIQRQWSLSVRPPYPAQTLEQSAVLAAGEPFSLDTSAFGNWVGASLHGGLTVAGRPPLNLSEHVRQLLGYPYGCLEQTSSRAYPLVVADDEVQARLQMSRVSNVERADRLNQAMVRLAGLQLASGGFGLWSDDSPEEHWLTAYVADFLLNAREQGFQVPEVLLNRSLDRLSQYLTRSGHFVGERRSNKRNHYALAYKAYAGYVLARVNRAPLAALRLLYQRYGEEAASPLPLVQLGLALKMAGDHPGAQQALTKAFTLQRTDEYLGDYGSEVRDTAWVIYLLLKHSEHTDYALAQSFELAKQLRGRRWLSTQERNALLLAGLQLEDRAGAPWQALLSLAGGEQALARSDRWYQPLAADTLSSPLSVINRGEQPLYVQALVNGYPEQAPPPSYDGYQIDRGYYTLDGEPVTLKRVAVGDLLLVHLQLSANEPYADTLVVDLLPAGFELENQNLKHAMKLEGLKIDGVAIEERLRRSELKHREFRDDRYVAALDYRGGTVDLFYLLRAVTPGRYQVPPPLVEDMYQPEYRAVGVSIGAVEIVPAAKIAPTTKAKDARAEGEAMQSAPL